MDGVEQQLRRLALNDEKLVGSVLAAGPAFSPESLLDRKTDAHERLGLAVEQRLGRERRPGGQHGGDEPLVVQRQAPQLLLDPVHDHDVLLPAARGMQGRAPGRLSQPGRPARILRTG